VIFINLYDKQAYRT